MINPIVIDLSEVNKKFNLSAQNADKLSEICVQTVTTAIYEKWEALAKRNLKSTLPEYVKNLKVVDKGRFAKQIILTGILPNMLESGAPAFDMKNGFSKSKYVKYTIPVYNAKGKIVSPGGDWYLTIPFRHGTPGIVGQAGFANEMPQEIYDIMVHRASGVALTKSEIPSPYDIPRSRAAILDDSGKLLYAEYQHKASIFEGLSKRSAAYNVMVQNWYGTFRRAGKNSDPLSWIHKGFVALNLAQKAIDETDVDTIVENEVLKYLDTIL
jgi:hypothetical protein